MQYLLICTGLAPSLAARRAASTAALASGFDNIIALAILQGGGTTNNF